MGLKRDEPVFVEVKSPGWEAEIAKAQGRDSARLKMPKHVHGEGGSTALWAAVRYAVKKAYRKMPDTVPTLLVINDDLAVALADWGSWITDIALYTPKSAGHTSGYLAENGPFADAIFERLGAVGVFKADLPAEGFRYRFATFVIPHALPAVLVPPSIASGYPRFDGSPPSREP